MGGGQVAGFVKLIFDEDTMNKSLKRQNIDTKKMPLGSLSKTQVTQGYQVLCEIGKLLDEQAAEETEQPAAKDGADAAASADDGGIRAERRRTQIKALSTKFYTTIPHTFPEGSPPSYIDNVAEVRRRRYLHAHALLLLPKTCHSHAA